MSYTNIGKPSIVLFMLMTLRHLSHMKHVIAASLCIKCYLHTFMASFGILYDGAEQWNILRQLSLYGTQSPHPSSLYSHPSSSSPPTHCLILSHLQHDGTSKVVVKWSMNEWMDGWMDGWKNEWMNQSSPLFDLVTLATWLWRQNTVGFTHTINYYSLLVLYR